MAGFGCAAYQKIFASQGFTQTICSLPQTVRSHITDPYKCIQGTKKLSNEDCTTRQIRPCCPVPLPWGEGDLSASPLTASSMWYDIAA